MHKKYQLYDLHACYGEVAVCDTPEAILYAAEQREIETNGRCDLVIRQWDENLQVYRPFYGAEQT